MSSSNTHDIDTDIDVYTQKILMLSALLPPISPESAMLHNLIKQVIKYDPKDNILQQNYIDFFNLVISFYWILKTEYTTTLPIRNLQWSYWDKSIIFKLMNNINVCFSIVYRGVIVSVDNISGGLHLPEDLQSAENVFHYILNRVLADLDFSDYKDFVAALPMTSDFKRASDDTSPPLPSQK